MMVKKLNKTKYLEEHFGGKWKYDHVCSWWCDDDKRNVTRTSSCMCEDPCKCPCRYLLYGGEKMIEIYAFAPFSWGE